jgi:hypothetical protein
VMEEIGSRRKPGLRVLREELAKLGTVFGK